MGVYDVAAALTRVLLPTVLIEAKTFLIKQHLTNPKLQFIKTQIKVCIVNCDILKLTYFYFKKFVLSGLVVVGTYIFVSILFTRVYE